ncbi:MULTISPECIES: hypothetical protein [unclassified Microbacterium]|uniref:hypothetical protein n=1 Tax=unclassified Microbacterium TaxID=2609290 RepID=UPI0021A51F72|nr:MULTISPECIES: hypothetical protein [unclassified Microbacterium]MCT1365058.1 hypothetical protein [Microbacterium sp. p3-SID131]MCT1378278.1 hypothetical protein [Microbacterium sp. p3-SID337]
MGKVAVAAGDYVHDDMPSGPRFGDDRWDCLSIRRQGLAERFLDFRDIPTGYRLDVKLFLLFEGRPHHNFATAAGVVLRRKPAPFEAMVRMVGRFSLIAKWGVKVGLASFNEWTQDSADDFIAALRAGNHRPKGEPNGPSSVRKFVTLIQQLAVLAPAAPHPLTFVPWAGYTASEVAEDDVGAESRTPPLPREETWEPLLAAATYVINECREPILKAHAAWRASPTSRDLGRGICRADAWTLIRDFLEKGGRIPLITAFGRNKKRERGQPNIAILQRKLGLASSMFKPSHPAYNPTAVRLIQQAVDDGLVEFGGLVACPPDSPFSEVGMDEAEYLPSVLRGACYVLIASLSAMRDSELQALKRGALLHHPDAPEIKSMTFKGTGVFGRPRTWWVPTVVESAVSALEALTQTKRLFARSGRTGSGGDDGEYNPHRDIRRLVDFANSAPDRRPGRGRDFGLASIQIPRGQAINARSLRRSFCVYAAAYPGMEVGIGIQLGHASLRVTGSYMRDRHHVASVALDDERAKVVQQAVAELIYSDGAIGGPSGQYLMALRAQIVADPGRAELLISRAAENYHLGLTNDCAHREETAACGPGGPKLADRICATTGCPNAVVHIKHIPVIDMQIERYDRMLDSDSLHPGFERNMREGRAGRVAMRNEIQGTVEGD